MSTGVIRTVRKLDQIVRQPKYTGENRCVPCTVLNSLLAIALAIWVASLVNSSVVGGTVLGAAAAIIYLRGYLVPGTPRLTKRYLPERVLAYFDGHGPSARSNRDRGREPDVGEERSVESILLEATALEPAPAGGEELRLATSFRSAWHDRIDELRDEDRRGSGLDPDRVQAEFFAGLDASTESLGFEQHGDAVVGFVDDIRIAQWPSRAAYLADVGAAAELTRRYPGWEDLPFDARLEVLAGVRLWLERCPACGGPVDPGRDTVESCCRSVEVVAFDCQGCDARVFEIDRSQVETV